MASVAIVHDYLNQKGGAERVALELARHWPSAPIYTALYRPDSTFPEFHDHDVRTSFLDRVPVDAAFRTLLPLYPAAFRSLGRLEHDLVVSSSSGWAHAVRTAPGSFHVVYCHAPGRWLYSTERYVRRGAQRLLLAPVLAPLRAWDRRAAARANLYIANAEGIRRRIRDIYGIDAAVVHPPVDVDRFRARPPGERLLVVSRLLPYKRVDLVVEAATRAGLPLDVVGTGPDLDRLRALAGANVSFHGRLDDAEITELMEGCRALCLPGEEDFGITPVEAMAAGKPVVAFAAGGALETVVDEVTGLLFREQTADALLAAVRRLDDLDLDPEAVHRHARRFAPDAFRRRLDEVIDAALEGRRATRPPARATRAAV
ncbi:MAG TPA: glycosyltransferase [Solirubrobacteraceae bacterium]|jgi:glycosyltransferase involved in cell wall biosynthesis